MTKPRTDAEAPGGRWSELIGLGGSMFRLSWALAVLGAQQAASLLAHSASGQKASPARPLDAVTNAVEEQFGGVFRGAYKTGREYLPGSGGGSTERAGERGQG